MNLVEIFL